jgi:hypothetical protein
MVRMIIIAALALLTTPAAAQTVHTVTGATPAQAYTLCAGDTLILRKPMGRELKADGSREKGWAVWIDRQNGRSFTTPGVVRLKAIGAVPGKGWGYAAVDAQPCASTAPPPPVPSAQLFGVNLSGCEFGTTTALCPNRDDIDWYIATGYRLLRIPVKDKHLTDPQMLAAIVDIVRYAQSRGATVILDRHDYTRHSAADAWAFWRPILPSFSAGTMIELANEPVKGYPVGSNPWMVSAQDTRDTVALFRANGVMNPILFGSPGYSATFRFVKSKGLQFPAEGMGEALDRVGGINDPLRKTYFSGHRYLDTGASGIKSACKTNSGDGGMGEFAAALRKRGLKAYVTEFAFGSYRGIPASCSVVGPNFIAAIKANSDVISGSTVWGGGRGWAESYAFKVEPKKGTRASVPVPNYVTQTAGR